MTKEVAPKGDDVQSRNNGKKTGKGHPPPEHRFAPGNPGRPKGARNKLGEAFLSALHDDFNEHGVEAIAKVRDEKPDQYLKVIASILPKDLNITVNKFDDLSEEDLIERLRALESVIRPFLGDAGSDRDHGRTGPQTAH